MSKTAQLRANIRAMLDTKADELNEIPGLIGWYSGGTHATAVPNRPGYSYVRLRGSNSDVIQAYNDCVLDSFGVPVKVVYRGGTWFIVGTNKDVIKDSDEAGTPYLVRHGSQHSWGGGTGTDIGDVTWVYKRQFMPLNVFPTQPESMSVTIQGDTFLWANRAKVFETQTVTFPNGIHPDDDGESRFVTICLNGDDKTIFFLTGAVFAYTGTVTYPEDNIIIPGDTEGIALAAVLFSYDTYAIGWDELWDVRTLWRGGGLSTGMYGLFAANTVLAGPTSGGSGYPTPRGLVRNDISTIAGDVYGPSASTQRAIARYQDNTGKVITGSYATVSDEGGINIPTGTTYDVGGVPHVHAGSGHIIQDEGVDLPARSYLNFIGAGVIAIDSGTGTNVTIPGGGGTPGGLNTHIQYNDTGSFGGDANLTWNKTIKELKVTGDMIIVNPLSSVGAIFSTGALSGADKTFIFPNVTGTFALGTGVADTLALWSNANTLTSIPNAAGYLYGNGTGTFSYEATATPSNHAIDGAIHTVSGRTAGQVFVATGATTLGWTPGVLSILTGSALVISTASNITITGGGASCLLTLPNAGLGFPDGGTLTLGGFTFIVPASGTAALRDVVNTFTATQAIQPATDVAAALAVTASSLSGGVTIQAGSLLGGFPVLSVLNAIGTSVASFTPDSGITIGGAVTKGAGTLNVSTGIYVNGTLIPTGTGTATRLAVWSATNTLAAGTVVQPATNVLTLLNSAASTLSLAITSGKTLTITVANDYNLTLSASVSIGGGTYVGTAGQTYTFGTTGGTITTSAGTLTVSSANAVSAAGVQTHAITSSSNPGAAASILASDASGFLTLVKLTAPTIVADTVISGYLPFGTNSTAANITVSGSIIYTHTVGANQTIKRWHNSTYVATTNDGSNYWTVTLKRADTLATLLSFNTSADAVNTVVLHSSTGLSTAITTGMLNIYIDVTKTGAPGGLYLYGPAIYVQ